MENQDKVLDVLNSFEKTPSREIPPVLEEYLRTVAKTGKTVFPWQQLKMLFVQKLEQVMEQFNKDDPCDRQAPFPNVDNTKFMEMRQRIIDALQKFNGAPFTVQRLCELVTQPKKHYTQCDKFLRGIEKNVMVVSTVDPNGRKIVSESSHPMVNGLDMNGVNQQRSDFNDFTDGQPFGPGPLVDWAGNNVATVWPEPTNLNKNNSNAESAISCTDDKVNNLKSDEKLEDNIESGLPKAEPEAADDDKDELVVKDCVVKDSVPSSVSINTVSNETENTTENKTENTEQKENQDITKNESSVDSKQISEMSTDSMSSGDSDNQSKVNIEEKSAEIGVPTEKHAMDAGDDDAGEPPEKKLKVDNSDESQESDSSVKETATEGPTSDKSQVQDTTVDTSQGNTTCEQTLTQDMKVKQSQEDESKSEESDEPTQLQEESSSATEDSQSKVTTQGSTVENSQSEDSLQITEKPESTENTSGENHSKTDTDISESAISVQESKDKEEPEKEKENGCKEQKEDNSGAEMMDTETSVENKETEAAEQKGTSDESEPMEQE